MRSTFACRIAVFAMTFILIGGLGSTFLASKGPIPLNCNRACTVNQGVLSTGQPYTFNGFNRPSSILVTEAFLIENGKIRHVEMIGPSASYHINSPWGGLSGN